MSEETKEFNVDELREKLDDSQKEKLEAITGVLDEIAALEHEDGAEVASLDDISNLIAVEVAERFGLGEEDAEVETETDQTPVEGEEEEKEEDGE